MGTIFSDLEIEE